MKVHRNIALKEFEFWAGARDTVKYLSPDELEKIEQLLEELFPDGIDETELNDLFWFDDELIAEWLGYESFEEIMERNEE